MLKPKPVHDSTSHGADAFRIAAITGELIAPAPAIATFSVGFRDANIRVCVMGQRQFVNWKRLEAASGDAVYAVVDGQVVRINSSLGKREAPLNGVSPEQVAYALWDELCMQE